MYITTQGLILRETNYKEADKILTVLTREFGKRTVKARGCRRKTSKLTAGTQLLVYSDMTLYERQERYLLHEVAVLEQFWGLRRDIVLLALASYFAEILEAVAQEGVPHPELLSLILNSMYALDTLGKPPRQVKAVFELSLMCLTGYEPRVDACAVCGEENPVAPRLSLREGVLHCATCRAQVGDGVSLPLTPAVLLALRHVAWGETKRMFSFSLPQAGLLQFSDLTEAFLLTQLERGFRTLDYYKQLTPQEL
jgi:DNA repair protein RecO (recombination protein O)